MHYPNKQVSPLTMEAFERRQTGTEGHRGGLLQRHFSCAVGKRACGDWSSLWQDEDAQDPCFARGRGHH